MSHRSKENGHILMLSRGAYSIREVSLPHRRQQVITPRLPTLLQFVPGLMLKHACATDDIIIGKDLDEHPKEVTPTKCALQSMGTSGGAPAVQEAVVESISRTFCVLDRSVVQRKEGDANVVGGIYG